MGIHCEINLHKSSDIFLGRSGNTISGIIKYAVDEETTFTKIVVSLKGLGAISLEEYYTNASGSRITYYNAEKYIDIDNVIEDKETGAVTAVGAYEIPFSFDIPCNVPPSVTYKKNGQKCIVKCSIKYYVRIKFSRRGVLNFTKRFKKPITIISGIVPRLSTTPIIYGEHKKLTQLFSTSGSVQIKATIVNSVLKGGDKIEFHYELVNKTNLTIKGVETKLVEVHNFFLKSKKPEVTEYEDVAGTDSKTCAIKSGDTQEMSCEINVPLNRESTDFSKIYSREYNVFITAYLPLPHRNFVLKIPVQISNIVGDNATNICNNPDPPSYWESMNEYKKDKIEFNELESNENVSKENQKLL